MHLILSVCSLNTQVLSAGDFMTQTTSHTAPTYQPIDDALAPWQKAIYEGNLSFECGDLVVARDHYTVAANIAETLMAQFTNIPYSHTVADSLSHCFPAFVVATHNLADTFKVMGQPEKACNWLCHAHQKLSLVLCHPNEKIRHLVLHHHHKTYFELVKFAQMSADFPELITRINYVLSDHPHKTQLLH